MTNHIARQVSSISNRVRSLYHPHPRIVVVFLLFGATCMPFQQSALTASAVLLDGATNQTGMAGRDSAVAEKWFIFTGPDGDFRLEFPARPSPETPGQGAVTLIRGFSLTTVDGMSFRVNFQDNGGDPLASHNNEWGSDVDQITSAADRAAGRRVVQIHRLAKNIVEAELWQTVAENGANINYLRRFILRRGRVYTLVCGSVIDGQKLNKPICERFFSSMKFISKSNRSKKTRSRK